MRENENARKKRIREREYEIGRQTYAPIQTSVNHQHTKAMIIIVIVIIVIIIIF